MTRRRYIRAGLRPVPALRHHVSVVISDGSQKQMVRADTSRGIATMQHSESSRNGGGVEGVGDVVCFQRFGGSADLPVATLHGAADPQPAISRLLDVSPESRLNRLGLAKASTEPVAVQPGAATNLIGSRQEGVTALEACARDSRLVRHGSQSLYRTSCPGNWWPAWSAAHGGV